METTHTLSFKLAKLMIAISWADGVLDNAEVNVLKDVLFSLPDLDAREWAELEIYMDSPVDEAEREILLDDLLASLRFEPDKNRVLNTIEALIAADGNVSQEERVIFGELKKAIKSTQTGVLGFVSKLTGGIVRKKREQKKETTLRERHLEDFISNKILYDIKRTYPEFIIVSGDNLKKLISAAALMGRVAAADNEFSPQEREMLVSVLVSEWNLMKPEAELLAEIVRRRVMEGLDYHYVALTFFERTTPEERAAFITCLFRMANASGGTSSVEIEEIRLIANSLKVSHSEFIDAKLTIPDRDRKGL